MREKVEGAGPYKFESWTTGEFIRLVKKDNWWGEKLNNKPLLFEAHPLMVRSAIAQAPCQN